MTTSDQADVAASPPAGRGPLRADRLAEGVLLLLGLTVLQRAVGLGRGILFCRWLSPAALGEWDLAFSFLLVAAPLIVLGLPGSLGRYVEHYRQRGELRTFLRRTALLTVGCTLLGVALMLVGRRSVARLLFDDPRQTSLVLLLAIGLLAVVTFNFLTELFTALRQMRVVSGLLLANSLIFALVGGGLLIGWRAEAVAVVTAYTLACLLTSVAALLILATRWDSLPIEGTAAQGNTFWAKLLPFAGWLWLTNLTANLFEVADRYMIVHAGGFAPHEAAVLVGNYHSSRVVPMLMVSVAGLLGAVVLPHLAHDWERGKRREVSDRMNLLLKVSGLTLLAGGVAIVAAGPLLFSHVLGGKYDDGLAVLPWTLVACAWLGLSVLSMNYLWCAERGRLVCLAYVPGLLLNVLLNLLLLPRLGLAGAVIATAAGNAAALVILRLASRQLGLRPDRAVWIIFALPLALAAGPLPAALTLAVALAAATRGEWLLAPHEKQELAAAVRHYVDRLRRLSPATEATRPTA